MHVEEELGEEEWEAFGAQVGGAVSGLALVDTGPFHHLPTLSLYRLDIQSLHIIRTCWLVA